MGGREKRKNMEQESFTKGPWKITKTYPRQGAENNYVIWATMPYQILQSQPGNDCPIGSVNLNEFYGHVWQFPTDKDGDMIEGESFNRSEIDAEANARLICAAPEMFEAMQWFCERVEKGEVRSIRTYHRFKSILNNISSPIQSETEVSEG